LARCEVRLFAIDAASSTKPDTVEFDNIRIIALCCVIGRGFVRVRPERPADSGRGRIWPAHFSEAGEAGKTEPTETHQDQKFPPHAGDPGVPAPRRGCTH